LGQLICCRQRPVVQVGEGCAKAEDTIPRVSRTTAAIGRITRACKWYTKAKIAGKKSVVTSFYLWRFAGLDRAADSAGYSREEFILIGEKDDLTAMSLELPAISSSPEAAE
jgi:hypothetical protein